jgi:hypothetical protein
MDKLKLIIACAIVVGLTQLEIEGGPQRKYYTGSKAIQARQEAAATGQLPAASGGMCTGDNCTMKNKPTTEQQSEHEDLRAQIAAQQKVMEEQAEALRKMQEQLDQMKQSKN